MTPLDQYVWQVLSNAKLTEAERQATLQQLIAEHGREAIAEAVKHWIDAGRAWVRSLPGNKAKSQKAADQ